MRVDRGRFLLLTSAIGAGACPTPVTPRGEPPKSDAGASAKTPNEPAFEPRWWATSEWWAEPYDPEYCVPAGGSWRPPPICGATSTGGCLSAAHPTSCAVAANDACTGVLAKACDRALDRLSAAVAPFAADCLASSDWLCHGQGAEFAAARCMIVAADRACDDPTVASTCARLVATCKNEWWPVERCRALFSGLSSRGRAHVEACVLESKCVLGPAECLSLR
jgi:hypothetical protein